jgi:hypothetical protein
MSKIKRTLPEDFDISESVDYEPRTVAVLDDTDMAVDQLLSALVTLNDYKLYNYLPELETASKHLELLIEKASRAPF